MNFIAAICLSSSQMPRETHYNHFVNRSKMAGKPRKFDTADELQAAIDYYFETVEGPLTITGLALALGFCDRQSLYDNEKLPEYSCIIKNARLRVENGYEKNLSANNPTGSIFALKNMGWRDKVETGFTDNDGNDRPLIYIPNNGRDESSNTGKG